jgi:hypothetical protein
MISVVFKAKMERECQSNIAKSKSFILFFLAFFFPVLPA